MPYKLSLSLSQALDNWLKITVLCPNFAPNSKSALVSRSTMKLIGCIVLVFCAQILRVFGVIGGSEANIYDIPFQAGIIPNNDKTWCGGVLISANYVLSSAQCLMR